MRYARIMHKNDENTGQFHQNISIKSKERNRQIKRAEFIIIFIVNCMSNKSS